MRRIQRSELPQFSILLGAMFLELVFAPLIMSLTEGVWIGRAAMGLVLLAALGVIGLRAIGVAIFALAMGSQGLDFLDWRWGFEIAALLRLVFFGYVFARVLGHVIRQERVTLDTIAAGVCTYMLLALFWGELFVITERLLPGSFSVPDTFGQLTAQNVRATLLYFSFTTLTTVGYGDIHAANAGVGGLAVSEAVAGQVYLAVLISRLVGMHLSAGDGGAPSRGADTPGATRPSSDERRA